MKSTTSASSRHCVRPTQVLFRSLSGVRSVVLLAAFSVVGYAQTTTTLIDDNFDTLSNSGARDVNGKFSTGTNASTWYYVQTNTLSATAGAVGTNPHATLGNFSGNSLTVNYNGTTNTGLAAFSATTLGVGDSLTVSFDFRYRGAQADNNRSPQFGFLNGTALTGDMAASAPAVTAGYSANVSDGTGGSGLYKGAMTPFSSPTEASFSTFSNIGYTDTSAIRFTFVLTRTTSTSIVASLYLNGSNTAALTATDLSATDFTFNEFVLRARGTADIDNLVVTYTSAIPEPSSYAVVAGAAALVAMTVVRRRRL